MMQPPDLLLVYITVRDEHEADELAEMLVQRRLAAGANILPGARSVYRWQGEIHRHAECLLLVQTPRCCFPALQQAVTKLHSYETPCIVAMPLAAASPAFARWIHAMTEIPSATLSPCSEP